MGRLTPLKQSIVDLLLVTVRKEKIDMENSNYKRRIFLMVETALIKGETAFAESMLLNFLGRLDLSKLLTWVNHKPRKSSLDVNDPESFWTDLK